MSDLINSNQTQVVVFVRITDYEALYVNGTLAAQDQSLSLFSVQPLLTTPSVVYVVDMEGSRLQDEVESAGAFPYDIPASAVAILEESGQIV